MFGTHQPQSVHYRGQQSAMAAFSRGLQVAGKQWKFKFANGYGASVINDGYGAEQGHYELGVLGPDGNLTYETPLTDDVLGWLTEDEVNAALDQIEALSAESIAEARAAKERDERDRRIENLEAELATLRAAREESREAVGTDA